MRLAILIVGLLLVLFTESTGRTLQRDESSNDSLIKPMTNNDHLEQCASVDFIMKQLGVVNVLAFLDASWPFSHKQASMLKLLKDRLQRSGLPETLFFVVISAAPSVKNLDDDLETAAWEGVAPEEALELTIQQELQSLSEIISSDIFVIQDNDELGIWRDLKGSRDQILVMDRCGKLAYQVIVPWSILHFPYVKAAILSTHNDDPCGACESYATVLDYDEVFEQSQDLQIEQVTNFSPENDLTDELSWDNESTTEDATSLNNFHDEKSSQESDSPSESSPNLPKLRIIMHAPHYHISGDSTRRHEYLVLESDKPDYHGHLDVPETDRNEARTRALPIVDSIVFDKDESPGLYGEVADYWRDNIEGEFEETQDNLLESTVKTEIVDDDGAELTTTVTSEESESVTALGEYTVEEEEESRSKLIAHYSRLLPWIYYVLSK